MYNAVERCGDDCLGQFVVGLLEVVPGLFQGDLSL